MTGPFSLIRELFTHTESVISICHVEGVLEITLDGFVIVTSQFLEGMKKSGFVLVNIRNSIDPEFLSQDLEEPLRMECEHDVPIFVWTIIRFKDTELPQIEEVDDNGGANETIAINNQTRNSGEEDRDLEIQAGVNN
ncbi:MAG: hypothetical protein ACJ71R_14705 [Nitrososphaeraceae archaeon]